MKFNTESNGFDLISKVEEKVKRSPTNPKVYKSNVGIDPNYIPPKQRRVRMPTQFDKYIRTSQITNLPGGVKRENTDINDNLSNNEEKKNNSEWFRYKTVNDYQSNVACLPGSKINNDTPRKFILRTSTRKYQSNQIFDSNAHNLTEDNIKPHTLYNYKNSNSDFDHPSPIRGVKKVGYKNGTSNYDRPSPIRGVKKVGYKNQPSDFSKPTPKKGLKKFRYKNQSTFHIM
ncbi:MAG: hypothetical protein MJ252_02835 [archaeon]|nr:hypothetical protein [archaeon]